MKKAVFLLLSLMSTSVFAVYDILLENNTPYALYINTGNYEDLPSKVQDGWHQKLIQPYERAKVQWFNFNDGIKFGSQYTFFVDLKRNPQDEKPLLTFETTIKGFLVGSSIVATKVVSQEEVRELIVGEPKPYFSTLVSKIFNNNAFGDKQTVTVSADAMKYSVPNPHKNFQWTDGISYVVTEKQPMYHHTDNKNELTVLSYNTQIWPLYGQAGGIIMNNPARRTEDIAAKVNDYDVVTVQEFFESDYRDTFTFLLQPYLPYHVGPASDMRPLSSGVVIYSRWPIEKEDNLVYGHCAGLDCGASKGASYAMINKYGTYYHVFSTHFQSGSEPNGTFSHKDAVARYQQLEALKAFIDKQHIPENEAVILTGDLNIDASSCYELNQCAEEEGMLNLLHASYFKHDNRAIVPYSTDSSKNWMNNGTGKNNVLDYVLPIKGYRQLKSYHSRILVLRAEDDAKMFVGRPYGDTDLSDHFPLEAKLSY
jgi:endonuclease/exonuclease/phosphatase family metal-dependent hydrolase